MAGRSYSENLSISAVFKQNKAAPMDNRLVVDLISDLTTSSTWNGYAYPTMIVGVKEDNNAYIYIGGDVTSSSNWKKLAKQDGLPSSQSVDTATSSDTGYATAYDVKSQINKMMPLIMAGL